MPRTITLATLLLLALPGTLQAQPRPAQIRGSIGLGMFVEAETHAIAGASWRKYLGARGWGFEVEGLTMRGKRHTDFQLALDVIKDLASPDRRTVPYLNHERPGLLRFQRVGGVEVCAEPRPGVRRRGHQVDSQPPRLHRAGGPSRLRAELSAIADRWIRAAVRLRLWRAGVSRVEMA